MQTEKVKVLTNRRSTKWIISKLIREKGIPEDMTKYVTQVLFEYKCNLLPDHRERVAIMFPDLYQDLTGVPLSKWIRQRIGNYCEEITRKYNTNGKEN